MSIRLLLVDDHNLFRAGLRSLLEDRPGMQVVAEVGDGLEALEAARREKPDVVVTDISMPGMNGNEVTRRITTDLDGVKVLALSMHGNRRYAEAALRAGASGYLLKDCAVDELVQAVEAVVSGEIYVSPAIANEMLAGFRSQEGASGTVAPRLTTREQEVLQLLAEGHSSREIASRLHVSVKTVGTHREHLFDKIGVQSVAGLTKFAIREGWTSVED